MAYMCVDCGFKGQDNYALNDHYKTTKHLEIVGTKLLDKKKSVLDPRLMTADEAKTYIHNSEEFRNYTPGLTEYFRRREQYLKNEVILKNCQTTLSMTEREYRRKQISEEYSTDDESDEKMERLKAVDYDHNDIVKIQNEMQEFTAWWSTNKAVSAKALAEAESYVRKQMILEFESVNVAKGKKDKKEAELELKIQLLKLKNS